jgi:4-hydroxythreonine-4-phosphate dehydrogenase
MSNTDSKSAERGTPIRAGAGQAGCAAPVIAVTSGEPAGVGPDICLDLPGSRLQARVVVLADREMLERRAARMGKTVRLRDFDRNAAPVTDSLEVLHVPIARPCKPGRLDAGNSRYVLSLIDRAWQGCMGGEFSAIVTAPVHKGVINDAGIAFTGHTEYLAQLAGGVHVVMMLAGGGLRVALATTHLALKDVPGAITRDGLRRTLDVLLAALKRDFGLLRAPRVLVAGLNPHSGEGGHLGREEIDVIAPVVELLRNEGNDLVGPLPADTLFSPERLRGSDCVLAMYHDQGLPVFKYASFGSGVNITLGLPAIRTSVDHGTALDLAGGGKAHSGSLLAAAEMAVSMAGRREQRAARVAE